MATAGPNYGGSYGVNNEVSPWQGITWSASWYITAADGNYAYITNAAYDYGVWSYRLYVQQFGFAISAGSTINGITVEINGYGANGASSPQHVTLKKSGTDSAGDDYGIETDWPATPGATRSFGGVSDLWGTTWTAEEINASTFGVLFANKSTGTDADVYIDYIRVTITYTEGAAATFQPRPPGAISNHFVY